MVEPTESEDRGELDRFVDAMIAIAAEIADVGAGRWALGDSPLRGAPHTAACLLVEHWDRPYTREQAAYPLPAVRAAKYWPPVRRIDGASGDRNLICTCPPVAAYAGESEEP
jgi:glycine dehydrogenase